MTSRDKAIKALVQQLVFDPHFGTLDNQAARLTDALRAFADAIAPDWDDADGWYNPIDLLRETHYKTPGCSGHRGTDGVQPTRSTPP